MNEQQMMYRDFSMMQENINREITNLLKQIVYGDDPSFKYSKDYILSEIEAVFGAHLAKMEAENGKKS